MVVVVAHWLELGVNVYVVVAELFIAGVQTPVMPLFDVVGKVNEPPAHIGFIWLKVGMIEGVTLTVMVVVVAHWFDAGVNVYVVVAVLLIAGVQTPVILLFDVVGKVNEAPEQIGFICVKVGVSWFVPEPDADTFIEPAPPPEMVIFPL
jgi:hypothetical protein